MRSIKRAAFFKYGSFSHINLRVEEQLRRVFPEVSIDVVDVGSYLIADKATLFGSMIETVRLNGMGKLIRRWDPKDSILQTPRMFDFVRDRLRRITRENGYLFTLQTQSLWDGASPGTPHFVYTDHTELANLEYPVFDRGQLMGDWWLGLERNIYQNATRLLTMSSHVSLSLLRDYGCHEDKVKCVFAGSNSDSSRLPVNSRSHEQAPLILFVGVDWERKGGVQLLAAFEELRKNHPSVRLRIIGCSPRIKVVGCEVLGRIPLGDMPAHYAEAAIFCLPTRIEPFGIAFVEAMHAGLPIVGTDLGAVRDMVTDGVNGFRVAVDDVAGTASALRRILQAPDQAARMGQASRQLAMEKYTWPAVGARIRSEILEVLETVSPGTN